MRDGHMEQYEPCIQIKKEKKEKKERKKRIKRKRKVKRKVKEETDSVCESEGEKNFRERSSSFSLRFTEIGS